MWATMVWLRNAKAMLDAAVSPARPQHDAPGPRSMSVT